MPVHLHAHNAVIVARYNGRRPLVTGVMSGFNGTLMAYGKWFTPLQHVTVAQCPGVNITRGTVMTLFLVF